MRMTLVLAAALFLVGCSQAQHGTPAPTPLAGAASPAHTPAETVSSDDAPSARFDAAFESRLRDRIEREAPSEVAVALVDLGTGRRLGINDTVRMHAASTMKVPVMLELFRQAEAGRFSLGDSLDVTNEFTSIADGSRYSLTSSDDSDADLYAMVGERTTLHDLTHRMITRSSNLATNILIELADPDSIHATLARIGADGMSVLRGVEDIPAFEQGMNNSTTADGLARVLEFIARCERGQAVGGLQLSAESCQGMADILDDQEFTDKIPAGVPEGVRVANKTGWITGIDHDGAILYPTGRSPYVLVVLTRDMEDREAASRVAVDLSRMVWEELTESRLASRPTDRTARAALAEHERYRVEAITSRTFTHEGYWRAVGPLVDASPVLEREEVGRSVEDRPIYLVRYGHGPTRVLLWSQMHGNESTATMALADLFVYLTEASDEPLARRLAEQLTILFVPMLNPDGVERFQRRNAYGIDINRDARVLATPEGRTLKSVQERFQPDFGFNLHDQNVRTRVGRSHRTAAIALLAPPPDGTGRDTEGLIRAKQVASVIRHAVEPLVSGHISRYDDTFNPRAFGDLMQQWGVSTVLVESGGWKDDPEKQYLRSTNFVGIRAALDAMATGTYADADPADYLSLEPNGRPINDLLVHGGSIVIPGRAPMEADLAINYEEPLRREGARLVDVGDLREVDARDTLDVAGLYLHVRGEMLDEGGALGFGNAVSMTVRRGAEAGSPVVGQIEDGGYSPADADQASAPAPSGVATVGAGTAVRAGIDVLLAGDLAPVRDARVGLITNHTGRGAGGETDIDLLFEHPEIELVALFSPEHGIRGTAEAGERVESGRDTRTGLPIHSLYGETRKPTPEMLADIDVLLFDIQDIGTRYYTYVWTLALALEAAAENDVRMVVLDRPNPIGGNVVQGNVLDPALASFVGLYPVPMRHGMTAGELALMLNEAHQIGADLEVVRAEGWERGEWYDQTGLEWIAPSPNMPSIESAAHYPGTCLFEGTNLSVGRGTDAAFQQIGAPWLDPEALVEALGRYGLPGVDLEPVTFTPERPGDGKFEGETVHGVRFVVTDRDRYDPTRVAVAALIEIQRLHADRMTWRAPHFDRLAGSSTLREGIVAGEGLDELTGDWPAQLNVFERVRRAYLLY